MASVASARAWAEEGLGSLWEDMQTEKFPMTLAEASIWIRAAYAAGYCNALAELQDGPPLVEVLENNGILQVLVPVS